MGFISDIGIAFAELTAGLANSRRRALGVLLLALGAGVSAALPPEAAELRVSVAGLRDARGMVILCLTRRADFLTCDRDPGRVTRIIPAGHAAAIELDGLPPGAWSLLAIHDANRNGKLDTLMGIPREGFAFSRNPAMRFGPPRVDQVRFALPAGESHQALTMKYLL